MTIARRRLSVPAGVTAYSAASSATWSNASGGESCANGNWAGGTAPKGLSASATLAGLAGAPAGGLSIDMDAPQRVGTITFSGAKPYTLGGTNPMVLLSFAAANVNVTTGTHSITAPLIVGSATTFNVSFASTLNVTNMQPTGSAITKSGTGTMNVAGLSCGALSVTGGTMMLTGGVSAAAKVTTLAISAGASVDVSDSKLVVKSGTVSAITALIQSGAIKTTMSDATTSVLTTLAVATAAECGYAGENLGGVSLAGSDVLVMYTWGGDADLNGELNGDDYFQLDSHILQGTAAASFHHGDFNYDGELNGDDYFVLDSNILYAQSSGINFLTGGGARGLAAIPEPSSLCMLAAAGAVLRRRR